MEVTLALGDILYPYSLLLNVSHPHKIYTVTHTWSIMNVGVCVWGDGCGVRVCGWFFFLNSGRFIKLGA